MSGAGSAPRAGPDLNYLPSLLLLFLLLPLLAELLLQVLECDSPSHITASSALSFTSGRHCWQIVVDASCDLAWVGVSNGNLDPDCWGGKQPGARVGRGGNIAVEEMVLCSCVRMGLCRATWEEER